MDVTVGRFAEPGSLLPGLEINIGAGELLPGAEQDVRHRREIVCHDGPLQCAPRYINPRREIVKAASFMHPLALLQILILVTVANATPVVAKRTFGDRLAHPVDGNLTLPDGRPLFGPSKTVRGLLLALIITAAAAPLVGI